jgi:HTH-type transcriptional regulator/antitoxin HigA
MIDALLDRPSLESDEQDYLEMLADLVERWDALRRPLPASPAEVLRHLMEARSLTQSEVASGAGVSQSTVSECLAGKRTLGRSPALKLAGFFGVGVAAFLDDAVR